MPNLLFFNVNGHEDEEGGQKRDEKHRDSTETVEQRET